MAFGIGGASIGIYGSYTIICQPGLAGCVTSSNLQIDCDGAECDPANEPWCMENGGEFICSTTLSPGSYSLNVANSDILTSSLPGEPSGNSIVVLFSEFVEVDLSGVAAIDAPEPRSAVLIFIGLAAFGFVVNFPSRFSQYVRPVSVPVFTVIRRSFAVLARTYEFCE